MPITRLASSGHATRRTGSFAGKGVSMNPVGAITRLGSSGHALRRSGTFAGKGSGDESGSGIPYYFMYSQRRGLR